ncbi:MAG: KEOPS complex subunit Cgi121 [Candidatus Nezhaarchaeota archaeon]|nr:KEOPS complex subunit Cgi121 [Candidatus Nezhaarchaeota archaeon]
MALEDACKELLSALISRREEVCIFAAHVSLKSMVSTRELVKVMESSARESSSILWSISRPRIPLSSRHVLHAFYHSLKAFALKRNISDKFNIEFLLRLSCRDQIKEALEVCGLGETAESFCLYVIARSPGLIDALLSRLTSCFGDVTIDEGSCYGDCLLSVLKVCEEELSSSEYGLSALGPQLKSILTRMSLLNVKR